MEYAVVYDDGFYDYVNWFDSEGEALQFYEKQRKEGRDPYLVKKIK